MVAWLIPVITAVVHAIGWTITKTYEVTKDIITQFLRVLPRPLRFFIFLFFILFMISAIMPVFIGTSIACDSYGNAYKISFVKLWDAEEKFQDLKGICYIYSNSTSATLSEETHWYDIAGVYRWFKNFLFTIFEVGDIIDAIETRNFTGINETQQMCNSYFEVMNLNESLQRDWVLSYWGEKIESEDYKAVVHVGCSKDNDGEWYQTLMFFNVDIFNFEMWLLLGLIGIFTPMVFKWYSYVFKR